MCGIFAYTGNNEHAGELVLNGLRSLEYRGYDSWGVALKKSDHSLYIKKEVGKIGAAKLPRISSTIGIGHTRWATHGGVTQNNAHPHTDCSNEFIVVHNGIVENFEAQKRNLLKKGHIFKSETDTEVIAHLLEQIHKTKKNIKDVVLECFSLLSGMNAVIVFHPKTETFYVIKNGSPIVCGVNSSEVVVASDGAAVIPYSKKLYYLKDNELLIVQDKSISLYNIHGKKKPSALFIQSDIKDSDVALGAYPHYMIKEINEQPAILDQIIKTKLPLIKKTGNVIKRAYGSFFIGCGSAYFAALSGTYLFSKISKRHVNCAVGSEFSYVEDFITKKSLIIALSQSGETIDVISSLKKAKEKKATILAITNVLGSTLYQISDLKLLLQAGPEKCVLATKSFTAKVAILYLLAHSMNNSLNDAKIELKKAIHEVERLIQENSQFERIANYLKDRQHIFILGRGISYPTALESALKIKEVSYIHAEGFAAGELKHGVIALIEQQTPVIVYNPCDETYADTLSSAYEIKARGAYVIGVSSHPHEVYDEFIEVKDCKDATMIPNVVVAQILAYHIACLKGLDPDKPRNLAKSVVVK